MSTYESNGLARYYLRTVARRTGCLWLILFLIMGLSMAGMAQYAGLAEGASTATATAIATVAATGAISGKILDQGGQPLTNIQVLALNQSTTTTIGGNSYFSPPPYGLSIYPPWTPEGLGPLGQSFRSYGAPYPGSPNVVIDLSQVNKALSKADGTFLLSNLAEGRYSLWAYDPQGRGFVPVIFGLNDSGVEAMLSSYYPYSPSNILIKVKSGQTAGPFNMTMTMGGKLSGRLTDADTGLPIKGAIVQASAQPKSGDRYGIDILPLLTSSDLNGNFTFSGLPEGKALVNVSEAEGYMTNPGVYYVPFEDNTYSVVAGQETSGCNMALKRSGTVSGKVTSKADGKPIAGAEISCFMTAGRDTYYGYYQTTVAVSAADGTYRISGMDTGTYVPMALRAPGFQGAYYPNTQDPEQVKEIHVELGKETSSINFQLIPSKAAGNGTIRGRIIDKESGLGVAGIQVNLSQMGDPYASYAPYGTTYYGTYPPYGSGYLLRNRAEAVASDSTPASASGGPNMYATTAYATTAYAPTVVSTVNEPMAVPPVPSDTVVAPTTTMSTPPYFTSYISPAYPVSIPVEPINNSPLPLLSDYYSYTYINPVWTDQEGNFEFTGLDYGTYSLNAYDPAGWYLYGSYPEYYPQYYSPTGYTPLSYIELSEKQSTSDNIEIALRRGGRLEGKVMAGSTPLAGMQITVIRTGKDYNNPYGYPVSYSGYGGGTSDTTDTAGEFSIFGLEDGEYVLLAENTTGSQKYVSTYCLDATAQGEKPRTFTVTAGSSATNLVISMKTGASITGKVVDKSGRPLAGITVTAATDWNYAPDSSVSDRYASLYYQPTRYAMTAEDGTYTVNGLSEGTYTLSTIDSHNEYQTDCCSGIKVAPPATVSAPDLVLPKGMVLSGKAISQDGQPLANISVSASLNYSYYPVPGSEKDQSGSSSSSSSCSGYQTNYGSATTAEDGTYRIPGLAAGSYQLSAYDQGGEYLSNQSGDGSSLGVITGAEGEVKTNIDLHLTQGATIKGAIRDAATGKPISGLTVTAQSEPANDPYAAALYGTSANYSYAYGPYYDPYGYNPTSGYATTPEVTEWIQQPTEVNGEQVQPDGQGVVNSTAPAFAPMSASSVAMSPMQPVPMLLRDSDSTDEPVRTAEPVSSMVMFMPPSAVAPIVPAPSAIMPTSIGYYPSYSSSQTYSSLPSDSQGNYTLHGLPAGKYRLYITDTAGKNYMSQYYAGKSSADEATVLEVNTAQTIENIDFNLAAGIILKGTIKDSVTGQPIATSAGRLLVTLTDDRGQGVKKAYAVTSGEYKFTGLHPGNYSIYVSDSQYYYSGSYLDASNERQAAFYSITISLPGPVEGADIVLQPKGSISGRVVDEYDQKPLANITVSAMQTSQVFYPYVDPVTGAVVGSSSSYYDPYSTTIMPYSAPYYRYSQSVTTDANGMYTLKGMSEGDYMVTAVDYSHIYGSEWYKDVPLNLTINQPDEPVTIHVGPSENKGGIDLALQVGETYTGADTASTSVAYYQTTRYPTEVYSPYGTTSGGGLYGSGLGGLYGGLYGSSYAVAPAPGYGSTYYSLSSSGSAAYGAYGSSYGGTAALTIDEAVRQPQSYTPDPYAQSSSGGQPPTLPTQLPTDASGNILTPKIVSSNSVEKITAGRTFTYEVKVDESAANTPLKYSLTHAPEGMNIDPASGEVQWKPSNSDAGRAIVQLKVDNGSGQVALETFSLGVEADTKPPEEVTTLKAAKGDQKVTISWKPSANSDADLADQILYVKEGNAPYGSGISLGKTTSEYTVENLKNGEAYAFKITTSDELANESSGVTATATPAREQAANAGNQSMSWYSPSGLWGTWPSSSLWSTTMFSSPWISSLWFNSTSTLGLWNTSPVTSLWGNYSTTSSGGISGTNSLWNSGIGSSNSFTNQDYRTRSLQPWNLTF